MAEFKARLLKKGLFEIFGLEEFIEGKVAELKRALGVRPVPTRSASPAPAPAPSPAVATPARAIAAPRKRSTRKPLALKASVRADVSLDKLVAALAKHPRRAELVSTGKEKDQLLRSLVPLYIARTLELEINSGLISRFWNLHGISYAAPNAAKALRNHVGYARPSKGGQRITPNGVKYVEAALEARAA